MKPLHELFSSTDILASKVAPDLSLTEIVQSSDKLSAGCAFFAIRGAKADGHEYVEQALQSGAAVVVVDRQEVFEKYPRTILVRSTRESIGIAASRWFDDPTGKLSLVGITGTNGKTTSAYLLKNIWESQGLITGMVGTVACYVAREQEQQRSKLTTPDALTLQQLFQRMVEKKVTHAAMEVTSIALDQYRVTGCQFDVALFTNLTQDHLDYHGTFEKYFEAKKRLFFEFEPKFAVLNADDTYGRKLLDLAAGRERFSFSLVDSGASFYPERIDSTKTGVRAQLQTPAGRIVVESSLIGRHNLSNILGVLGVTHALGGDLHLAALALRAATGAPGRLERVAVEGGGPHVFVDFAHTDDGLANVLETLVALRGEQTSRIITVFGCGGDRDRGKRPRMGRIASTLSDITIATSDNPRTEDPSRIIDDIEVGIERGRTQYHREPSRREAVHLALSLAQPGDLVLVAGKGHETYQLIGDQEFPFDDRQVIRDYYHSNR